MATSAHSQAVLQSRGSLVLIPMQPGNTATSAQHIQTQKLFPNEMVTSIDPAQICVTQTISTPLEGERM